MQQLLQGLAYLHEGWVLHRDLKPSNLLLTSEGQLKLGDFGLAKAYGGDGSDRMSPNVVTRWYRAPELLLGAELYTGAVDLWAAGAIAAELLVRTPFFPGHSDLDQLARTYAALGTPTEEGWPGHTSLPLYVAFEARPPTPMATLFPSTSREAQSLLGRLLTLNPSARPSAKEALGHPWFRTGAAPTPASRLPLPPGVRLKVETAGEDKMDLDPQ